MGLVGAPFHFLRKPTCSGDCSDRAIGPIDGVEQPWSVAVRNGNDPDQLSRFLCSLADLSPAQQDEERCDRFE